MRNLPAFATVRKACLVALWGGGLAGWLVAAYGFRASAESPAPVVEPLGLPPLWPEACPPVVASGRGERYYWAWCEAAGKLKPQNLRTFCGPEEAVLAGLSAAKGCGDEPG